MKQSGSTGEQVAYAKARGAGAEANGAVELTARSTSAEGGVLLNADQHFGHREFFPFHDIARQTTWLPLALEVRLLALTGTIVGTAQPWRQCPFMSKIDNIRHLIAGQGQADVVRAGLGADWQQQRDVERFGRQPSGGCAGAPCSLRDTAYGRRSSYSLAALRPSMQ